MGAKRFSKDSLKKQKEIIEKKKPLQDKLSALDRQRDAAIKKAEAEFQEKARPLWFQLSDIDEKLKKIKQSTCPQRRQHRAWMHCRLCGWSDDFGYSGMVD